jgi:hypothetical protein
VASLTDIGLICKCFLGKNTLAYLAHSYDTEKSFPIPVGP